MPGRGLDRRAGGAAHADSSPADDGRGAAVLMGSLARWLTSLPGRAGRRLPGRSNGRRGGRTVPRASVLHRVGRRLGAFDELPGSHLRVVRGARTTLPGGHGDC
jgi:hypothetical protein